MAHTFPNPYSQRPSKLDQLNQMQESDAQQAQGDSARQNAMMEQFARLYGIQQQQQLLPEHLRSLQLANEGEAAKVGHLPQQYQNEDAMENARTGAMAADTRMSLAKLGYLPEEHEAQMAHEKLQNVGLGNQNAITGAQASVATQSAQLGLDEAKSRLAGSDWENEYKKLYEPKIAEANISHTNAAAGMLNQQAVNSAAEGPATVAEHYIQALHLANGGAPLDPTLTSATLSGQSPYDVFNTGIQQHHDALKQTYLNQLSPKAAFDPATYQAGLQLMPKAELDLHISKMQQGQAASPQPQPSNEPPPFFWGSL